MKVPEHMMGSEVSLTWNGMDYRADIVVYDRSAHPLLVVECKRPEVELSQEVVDQAIRYISLPRHRMGRFPRFHRKKNEKSVGLSYRLEYRIRSRGAGGCQE